MPSSSLSSLSNKEAWELFISSIKIDPDTFEQNELKNWASLINYTKDNLNPSIIYDWYKYDETKPEWIYQLLYRTWQHLVENNKDKSSQTSIDSTKINRINDVQELANNIRPSDIPCLVEYNKRRNEMYDDVNAKFRSMLTFRQRCDGPPEGCNRPPWIGDLIMGYHESGESTEDYNEIQAQEQENAMNELYLHGNYDNENNNNNDISEIKTKIQSTTMDINDGDVSALIDEASIEHFNKLKIDSKNGVCIDGDVTME